MSVNSLLHVGASGLRAATLGVNVTSQNATNATTAGYTRRTVVQDPVPGPPKGGGGVSARGPQRIIDRFIERRLLGATSSANEAAARRELSEAANFTFSEGAGSLGQSLEGLESALRLLASSPGDRSRRSVALAQAESVVRSFGDAQKAIGDARSEADRRIEDAVAEVNRLTADIERLQAAMRKAEINGVEASDLRDQRDQRIRELSVLVPATVHDGPNGTVSVLLGGGRALVQADGGALPLTAGIDGATGRVVVRQLQAGAMQDITSEIDGGRIGGLLASRDGVLLDAQNELDQLAFDVAGQLNAVHQAGYGLDGVTGRPLLTVSATASGAAASLAIDPAVAGNPDALAAAQDPALLPGDNRSLLALIDVFSTPTFAGGTETVHGALANLVADVGTAVETADTDIQQSDAQLAQVQTLRDSISGTSSDDEMVSLMSYQRAYEASLRVVQAADDMLARLIDLGR